MNVQEKLMKICFGESMNGLALSQKSLTAQ